MAHCISQQAGASDSCIEEARFRRDVVAEADDVK
jgi:hypothetical protein